jgi:hypothetical protein
VGGLVDTAQGQAASVIKGLEADYLAHKLAHALAGCVAGAAAGGQCKDGAIGAALGEVVGQMFKPANGMFYTEAEKDKVLAYSKLVAGAVTAYAGGNAQTAITTSEVAVKNNLFFVPPLVALLAGAAGYTTVAGGGNPVAGLQAIGQGNDPLSRALANGTQAAVSLSMDAFPKETAATLTFLNWAGGNIGEVVNATVTYVDDKTGRLVSTQWNSLSPATRDALIGANKVTSVVLGVAGVSSLRAALVEAPNNRVNTYSGKPLGLGSTGRSQPLNLAEQLALEQALSQPAKGEIIPIVMLDSRWPASDGWVKMTQEINGVVIHYVRNMRTGAVDDFKFK